MELRTLRYFMAVIEEGSITNASKRLHVTQPTLSRQLSDLEQGLGRQLFTRSHAGIIPTEHGAMLAKYAESIISLADKAEADIALPSKTVAGSVHIGCGETRAMELLARAMLAVRAEYPEIDFQLYSGTTADLMDGLVRGRFDFLLECEVQPHVEMNVLKLPHVDRWGVVVHEADPLAALKAVSKEHLRGRTLITSRQGTKVGKLGEWFGAEGELCDVSATYSLGMNAKFLVREGLGVAVAYEGLIGDTDSDLRFVPLDPPLSSQHGLVWRKALPSRQAQVFLDAVKAQVNASENEA